ncbi:MAG: hypothetical protein HY674_12735 [Chloroflexi bacterium]|nr:hypothetical protein [Chloroflexota bacterium]
MPKPGGPRWLRLFTASLFLFSVNYVPLHLALEMHLDHLLTAFTQAAEGPSFKAMRAQTEDDDDHAPHFASDHLLRLAPQSPWHSFGFDWAAVETNVPVFTPQPQTPLFLTERQNPPGLPPPDPLQPRAPPHA